MTAFPLFPVTLGPGLLAPLGAMALLAAGVAMIASGLRVRRELVARRVDLVRPRTAAAKPKQEAGPSRLQGMPFQRLSLAQQLEISRLFSTVASSSRRAMTYFTVTRLVLAAGSGVLGLLWADRLEALAASPVLPVAVAAVATVLGWFLPLLFLRYRLRQRAKVVSAGLPDALELLVICVEAGLSLEDGLARVVKELARSQPALAQELALTAADLKILPSRDEALARLAERVDVPTVRSVVATLSQTLRYGTPLAKSLRTLGAEVRNDFLLQLEERANRLPALLTLPVILFIMPTIFLIIGGPAALRLIDIFPR